MKSLSLFHYNYWIDFFHQGSNQALYMWRTMTINKINVLFLSESWLSETPKKCWQYRLILTFKFIFLQNYLLHCKSHSTAFCWWRTLHEISLIFSFAPQSGKAENAIDVHNCRYRFLNSYFSETVNLNSSSEGFIDYLFSWGGLFNE